MNFDTAFVALMGHEGGLVDDPHDPGRITKYGISQRAYPKEDIPNLTMERAKAIYFRDYWTVAGCESVPDGIKFDLFDAAVNSGPTQAIKFLQQAVQTVPDGQLGPVTLQAAGTMPTARLVARFNALRLNFMTDRNNWPYAGKGWAKRISSNILRGV